MSSTDCAGVIQVRYTNFTNLDAEYGRPYEPGDRLVRGWAGEINEWRPTVALERIFQRHNADNRPDGQLCPSMSVGDVVIIGESAWSVDHLGFVQVELDAADLILNRSWLEVVRDAPRNV